MPEIKFDHFMLRTLQKDDYQDMFLYGKDPEVVKYLSWGPFTHEKEAKDAIKKIFLPRIRQGLPVGYAIIDVRHSKMIGTIDFHSKIKEDNSVEIGYVLNKDYWQQGIMTKALQLMIDIGFNHLNYDILRIRHLSQNIASKKVIDKTAFKLISITPFEVRKQHIVMKDNMLNYELKKENYHGSQQS